MNHFHTGTVTKLNRAYDREDGGIYAFMPGSYCLACLIAWCLHVCMGLLHWEEGPEKAHQHLADKQFLGDPGHRSSRQGTRMKMFTFFGFCTQHIGRLTPGHQVGRTPPPTRAVTGKICLCLCACSFPEEEHVLTNAEPKGERQKGTSQ